MIMLYSDYSENGVITSCIPMIKRAEKKLISAVILTVLISQFTLSAVGYKHSHKSCLVLFLLLYNIVHHYVSVLSSQNPYYYTDMNLVYL
jgi:hypothetical protein